jgi:hypothetical protein
MTYTQLALVGVGVTVVLDTVVFGTRHVLRRSFWLSYAIIVACQLVTNGVLAGMSIVRYSGDDIIGSSRVVFIGDGRFAFAPVEDLLFGFSLVLLTLSLWVWWGRRGVQFAPLPGPPRWRDERSRPE